MKNEPFFVRDGEHYLPQAAGRGPWNAQSLHGRVVIGLLGHGLEKAFGSEDFVPARLTVDMYKLPGFDPVEIKTTLIRESGRLRMAEAEFVSGGVSMGKASCQFLRRTAAPEGEMRRPANWDAPLPETLAPLPEAQSPMGGMWATRAITGGFGEPGPRRMWMSEVRELVAGEALTPFQRVAVAADFCSPFANSSINMGLAYINTDVTLYLHRPLVGEWVGFEAVNHQSTAGVAIGECWLYDREGAIGTATCAALAQRRMAIPGPSADPA